MKLPVDKNIEQRGLFTPLSVATDNKLIESDYYIEGYATTFNKPYVMWEYDGVKYCEEIDRYALDGADMRNVIMQYDHVGRIYARKSNNTLVIVPDDNGLKIAADLSKTNLAKGLYEDIAAEMITKMSWAFTVEKEEYDQTTHTRKILKIKKVYDVSAVSIPANDDTEIAARSFAKWNHAESENLLIRRVDLLKIRTTI